MKEYTIKQAAQMLNHRGGCYGLKLDIENAPDFPVRVYKERGRWHGLNDLTLGVLKAYYAAKVKEGDTNVVF